MSWLQKKAFKTVVAIVGGIFGCLSTRYIFLKLYRKYRCLPNGPISMIPIFGNFFSVISDSNKYYIWLATHFGAISTYQYGMRNIISINDPKLLQKIFSNKYTLNRYPSWSPKTHDMHFGFINGSDWRNRRKIMLQQIPKYINGNFIDETVKKCMNKYLLHDIDKYIENNVTNNNSFDISSYFTHITFNTIITAYFGKKYELKHNDKWLVKYSELNEKWTNEFFVGLLPNLLFPNFCNLKSNGMFFVLTQQRYELLSQLLKKSVIDENDHCLWNYYHSYINNNNIKINEKQILWDFEVMIGAAIETTTEAMSWAIYLATKYTHIQHEIYKELKTTFHEHDNDIKIKNLYKIHKLKAFVYESQRLITLVPTGLFHLTSKDIEIKYDNQIYNIPKNMLIHPNIIAIHSNQKYWKYDVNKFNLKNWLDMHGNFILNKSFVGFSTGKRNCPGNALAIKQILLVMAMLLLQYEFYIEKEIDIKPIQVGLVTKPSKPICVKIRKRDVVNS